MSGKGQNSPRGESRKLANNIDAINIAPAHAGKVTSNNREQHLGRSFPETNGKFHLPVSDPSSLGRDVAAMANKAGGKQHYEQPKVSYGQRMPDKGRKV